MRTSADFFVHRYIPPTVRMVNYRQLAIGAADNAFFRTIPTFVTLVDIADSKQLSRLVVPGQSNISVLNVARTGLRRIDVEKHSAMVELFIAYSNIAHISPSISNLKASRNIAVTNCWLESLDLGAFCDMPKLNMLNFCENRIRYIQNSANGNCSLYNSLETLTLSRNFLRSLNMELFNPFRSLMYLTLKENRIEAVFGQFETDTDFNLFLTNNNIKVFDVCEWNVPRMLWLELQHNNLSTVPNCLEHLKSVQSIALSYNQLANVSIESFAKMESLSKLILSSNSMTLISFNTDQYPANLRTVWITNNNLTELDLSLVAVSSLEVNAQDNYIEVFDVSKVSANVTTLCMIGNPINCSWRTVKERLNLTCVKNKSV
ncbi:leucine-rich repeat protein SHOC-2-like [Anopheles stephensi]|uniref:leucine-rich repeat protein SHOC-2-like n=1 Tax=Anopheles stephensi TaxID=30069 RepID=UPI001658B3DD|nr:leucine-rich repeat protein SHOC-2-like [Anopheles stephensi]